MNDKKYVVGNLKMAMKKDDVSNYLKIVNDKIDSNQVVIIPSSIYVPYFLNQYYRVGLQDVHFESTGPYTGEVSPLQAKSMGISCALVGHSERKKFFKDTDTIINKKVLESLANGISVILCVGETSEERDMLKTDRVLKKQINHALRYVKNFGQIMIAYEPVWAIGTKVIPKNSEIEKTVQYIKDLVKKEYDADIKVLYGGSVDDKNIHEINKIKNLNGVLVGNAATDAEKFLHIIEVVLGE